MAVSGDGRRALSGAWDDTLVWNVETSERLEPQELDTLQSDTGADGRNRVARPHGPRRTCIVPPQNFCENFE